MHDGVVGPGAAPIGREGYYHAAGAQVGGTPWYPVEGRQQAAVRQLVCPAIGDAEDRIERRQVHGWTALLPQHSVVDGTRHNGAPDAPGTAVGAGRPVPAVV